MSEMRVIRARYADWRPVKGRKVLQIVLEVPLEQQGDILTMLGAPLPDRDLWVAVARISDEQNEQAFKGGELARRAGILANDPAFQKWASVDGSPAAGSFIRTRCGIESRRMIDHDEKAQVAFFDMTTEYQTWLETRL